MNKLFRYSGNKENFVPVFNDLVNGARFLNYYEPFVGSGSILYNCINDVPRTFVGDSDPMIVRMHRAVAKFSYGQYIGMVNAVDQKFGDVKESKEAYYGFRNYWNDRFFKDDSEASGLVLIYLASTCINSMLRFGPNGMNQSFGKRKYVIGEQEWNHMHDVAAKSTITCGSYFDVNFADDSLIFLDPPYYVRKMTYDHGFDTRRFVDSLKNLRLRNSMVIYTDMDNEVSDSLTGHGFSKTYVREMRSTSPSRGSQDSTGSEVCYVKRFS